MSPRVLRKRGWKAFLKSLAHVSERLTYKQMAHMLGLGKWHIYKMLKDPEYLPSDEVKKKINVVFQPNRTPGGWVNAKSPRRAAEQLAKRAEYDIGDLIYELVLWERRRDRRLDEERRKEERKGE